MYYDARDPYKLDLGSGALILIWCQELFSTPRKFQISSTSLGWTFAEVSTYKREGKHWHEGSMGQ